MGASLSRSGSTVNERTRCAAAQRGDAVLTGDLDDLVKLQALFAVVRLV